MKDDKINWTMILILFFGGWLGIDKIYALGFKKGWKLFVVKLLGATIGIGELWNILDIVMSFLRWYRADPREYLDLIETRQSY